MADDEPNESEAFDYVVTAGEENPSIGRRERRIRRPSIPHSDGTFFSDGTGYRSEAPARDMTREEVEAREPIARAQLEARIAYLERLLPDVQELALRSNNLPPDMVAAERQIVGNLNIHIEQIKIEIGSAKPDKSRVRAAAEGIKTTARPPGA